jgi:NTP pyrophosphatase (non-canonical NTP hydrolase)
MVMFLNCSSEDPMPTLNEKPTLTDIQRYVTELEHERGFNHQDVLQKCLLLGEEVGELFKAIRKHQNMSLDVKAQVGEVKDEVADVLVMLCSVANRLDINLEEAFRAKEEINKNRNWK